MPSMALNTTVGSPVDPTIKIGISVDSSDSHQNESPAPIQGDEDCFCCCSHILPGLHFVVAGIVSETLEADPTISSLPTGPPHTLYHPPRLS